MIIKISKVIMITTMCNNVSKQVGVQASMSKLASSEQKRTSSKIFHVMSWNIFSIFICHVEII